MSEAKILPKDEQCLLLSEHTSHANKMAFLAEYQSQGFFVETDWTGNVRKRARFRFEPSGHLIEAKDYLNDVVSKYKDAGQ